MLSNIIQGQPKAVKLLSRALQNNRLAHAYLFTGPGGVGKIKAAKALTAILFCPHADNISPCGNCPGCLKFATKNHPDFLHIQPQGATIKIDQVRELKKTLGFPPLEAETRVTLIEDVHTMRREAANSLLKLLEEPPPDNILLLTADEAEPLLPTIVSRCQVIPFYPLPTELTAEIIRKQNPELAPEKASLLATLTNGCPGLAKSIDGESLITMHGDILDTLLHLEGDEAHKIETALSLAAKTAEMKNEVESLLNLLRFFFKETMISAMLSENGRSNRYGSDPRIENARERWNLQELSDKVGAIDFAEQALDRNCNLSLVCEVLFLNLVQAKLFDNNTSPAMRG